MASTSSSKLVERRLDEVLDQVVETRCQRSVPLTISAASDAVALVVEMLRGSRERGRKVATAGAIAASARNAAVRAGAVMAA